MSLAAAVALVHVPVMAQDADAGPDRFQAAFTSAVSHSDNFYYQPVVKQAVSTLVLQPDFKLKTETTKVVLDMTGSAQYGVSNAPGTADDYIDRRAGLDLGWTPTSRNRFYFSGYANHGHDPFGLVRTEGAGTIATDLDEWTRIGGSTRYRYGAPSARVNAEVGASVNDVHYTTNEVFTKFLDYRSSSFTYSVFYNVTPKSALLMNFLRTHYDFDLPFDTNANGVIDSGDVDTRSGDLYQIRTGVRWLATAKTSGDVRAGYRQRTFREIPGDLQGLDWEAGINWSPTVPMVIEAKTLRSEDESYRADAGTIDLKVNLLALRRTIGARSRLSMELTQARSSFLGAGRYDETRTAGIGLEYAALSHIFLVGNVGYQTRDSSVPNRDYHRLTGFIGLRFGQLR